MKTGNKKTSLQANKSISVKEASGAERRFQEAIAFAKNGKDHKARKLLQSLISQYPDYVAALFELANTYIRQNDFHNAASLLAQAAMYNPADHRILGNLAAVYYELEAYDMAEIIFGQLRIITAGHYQIHFNLGNLYSKKKEYEAAATEYEKVLELRTDHYEAALGLGSCYDHLGRMNEAYNILNKSLSMASESILPSISAISALPRSIVKIDLQESMDQLRAKVGNQSPDTDNRFQFTEARIMDADGQFEEAWKLSCLANEYMANITAGEYASDHAKEKETLAWARSLKPIPGWENRKAETNVKSLFVLGPSRSGKSTTERMLLETGSVKGGFENLMVATAVRRANQISGRLSDNNFAALPEKAYPAFAHLLQRETENRANGMDLYTTTTPGLIINVPRIAMTIPNSRFIFVKRDIHDIAIRIFMRRYRSGNTYAYSLRRIKDYIHWYNELIDIWTRLFPERTKVIQYEDLAKNPDDIWQELINFCGLDKSAPGNLDLGNDTDAAAPYRKFMDEKMQS